MALGFGQSIAGRRAGVATALAAALLAVGCATAPPKQEIHDHLEPVNRPVFGANVKIDDYVLGPVARGWKRIAPGPVRRSIANLEKNLEFPVRFLSRLGQAQLVAAGTELGRFLLNSTVGVAGLFDPARSLGLEPAPADFGMMFARWGIPSGGYIVVPIFGPSTPRETIGDVLALPLDPLFWFRAYLMPIDVLFVINDRAQSDDVIREARKSALDLYVFTRDAFIQRRDRQLRGEYVTQAREDEDQAAPAFPPDLYDEPPDRADPPAPNL